MVLAVVSRRNKSQRLSLVGVVVLATIGFKTAALGAMPLNFSLPLSAGEKHNEYCSLAPLRTNDAAKDPAVSLIRHNGQRELGDICHNSAKSTFHCPHTCRVASNSTLSTATSTIVPPFCELDVPFGWEAPPCRVPLAGAPPWRMPWEGHGKNGEAHNAPADLFDSDLAGPKPEILHIAAISSMQSNQAYRCWSKWIMSMISADPSGKYRLHLIAGTWGNEIGGSGNQGKPHECSQPVNNYFFDSRHPNMLLVVCTIHQECFTLNTGYMPS